MAVVNDATVYVTGATFTGGKGNSGASIYTYGNGNVTLEDCTITEAETTVNDGGCISADANTKVRLIRSLVNACRSAATGGGISVLGNAHLVVTNTNITGCSAVSFGGGLWADANASIVLDKAQISGNRALEGGGLYLAGDSDLQLLGTSFCQNNSDSSIGGGVRLRSAAYNPDEVAKLVISKWNKAYRGLNPDVSIAPRAMEVVDIGNTDSYVPSANMGDGLHFTVNLSGPHGLRSDDEVYMNLLEEGTNNTVFSDSSWGETGEDLRKVTIRPKALPGK